MPTLNFFLGKVADIFFFHKFVRYASCWWLMLKNLLPSFERTILLKKRICFLGKQILSFRRRPSKYPGDAVSSVDVKSEINFAVKKIWKTVKCHRKNKEESENFEVEHKQQLCKNYFKYTCTFQVF